MPPQASLFGQFRGDSLRARDAKYAQRRFDFGVQVATTDFRNRIDLLIVSLNELKSTTEQDIEIVILGSSRPKVELNTPFPVYYMGNLSEC